VVPGALGHGARAWYRLPGAGAHGEGLDGADGVPLGAVPSRCTSSGPVSALGALPGALASGETPSGGQRRTAARAALSCAGRAGLLRLRVAGLPAAAVGGGSVSPGGRRWRRRAWREGWRGQAGSEIAGRLAWGAPSIRKPAAAEASAGKPRCGPWGAGITHAGGPCRHDRGKHHGSSKRTACGDSGQTLWWWRMRVCQASA